MDLSDLRTFVAGAELARDHPKLSLDFQLEDRVVDPVAERFDLALRIGRLRDSTLVAQKVGVSRRLVVASLSEPVGLKQSARFRGTKRYVSWGAKLMGRSRGARPSKGRRPHHRPLG